MKKYKIYKNFKVHQGTDKLKECDQQANRNYRIGFTIPVADWDALEDRHKTPQELNEKWCKTQEMFNKVF